MLKNLIPRLTSSKLYKNKKKLFSLPNTLRKICSLNFSESLEQSPIKFKSSKDIEIFSLGIVNYFEAKDQTNFKYDEILNSVKDTQKQIGECKELIQEVKQLSKEASLEDKKSLKQDLKFYEEELATLLESKDSIKRQHLISYKYFFYFLFFNQKRQNLI